MLTASDGRKANFRNAVIIMTSNVGARLITENRQNLGFVSGDSAQAEDKKKQILEELKKTFKPEFINRVDDVIIFNKLTKDDIGRICVNMLGDLSERASSLGMEISFEESAVEKLAQLGYDDKYGARPLRRVITSRVEDMLAQRIVEKQIGQGGRLKVKAEGEEFLVETL